MLKVNFIPTYAICETCLVMSTVSWCRPFTSIGASVDERKQEEKRSFNSAWQSTRLLREDNELEGLFSRLRLFSPSLTMSGCWQKTSVCARQTLGIVVIIDLLHSAHTVMGKCRNWTDQRHPGSTVGTQERSAAAGKAGGWLGGWGTTQPPRSRRVFFGTL